MAPRLDLQILKDLDSYKTDNAPVSAIAHSPEGGSCGISLRNLLLLRFLMIRSRVKPRQGWCVLWMYPLIVSGELNLLKRTKVDAQPIQAKELEHFVSQGTHRFFDITGLPSNFLDNDVNTWGRMIRTSLQSPPS